MEKKPTVIRVHGVEIPVARIQNERARRKTQLATFERFRASKS